VKVILDGWNPTPDDRARIELFNRGIALMGEFKRIGEAASLARAYHLMLTAEAQAPAHWPVRPIVDYNMGLALLHLARLSDDEALCEQALAKLQAAAHSEYFAHPDLRPLVMSEIAATLAYWFKLSRILERAQAAVQATRALLATAVEAEDQVAFGAQLGSLLFGQWKLTNDRDDLDSGLDAIVAARAVDAQIFRRIPGASRTLRSAMARTLGSGPSGEQLRTIHDVATAEHDAAPADFESRAGWLEVLSQALHIRFERTGHVPDERRALDLVGELLKLHAEGGHDRDMQRFLPAIARMPAALRDELYGIYLRRFPDTADLSADLDARPELKAALFADVRLPDDFTRLLADAILAQKAYEQSGDPADIARAAALSNDLLETPSFRAASPESRAVVLQAASSIAYSMYWASGDLEQLQLAVTLAREAYADVLDVHRRVKAGRSVAGIEIVYGYGISSMATSLASILIEAYARTRDRGLLDEAIACCGQALDSPGHQDAGQLLHDVLGTALRHRYEEAKVAEDLLNANRHHEEAVRLERDRLASEGRWEFDQGRLVKRPDEPDRLAQMLSNLGGAQQLLYLQTRAENHLDEATALHAEALSLASPESPSYAGRLHHLLEDLILLDKRHPGSAESRLDALYAQAASLEASALTPAFGLHRDLAIWAFGKEDWRRAADGYARASDARDQLQAAQIGIADKQHCLGEARGFAEEHAYALARLGEKDQAVAAAEHGLARLVSESLRLKDAQLDRLRSTAPDRVAELLAARQEIRLRETRQTSDSAAMASVIPALARRRAWTRLRAAEEAVGLSAPEASVTQIRQQLLGGAADHAAVYLSVTRRGSLALIVTADAVHAVWPPMSSAELNALAHGLDKSGYNLIDYTVQEHEGFLATLSGALKTLGDRLAGPLADHLSALGVRTVTLIPAGRLSLLPLHAASLPGPGSPGYFLESFAVSYLPNAVLASHPRANHDGPGARRAARYLGVAVPEGTGRRLLHAEQEVKSVASRFPRSKVLVGPAAEPRQVLAQLARVDVAHFACHSAIDPSHPLDSGLILSGGARLTVRDLLDLPRGPRLVILSACATAMPGADLPDEALGLPAALLSAGADGVLATAWLADDLIARLIVEDFIDGWLTASAPASSILRAAQLRIRNMTPQALAERLTTTTRAANIPATLHRPFGSQLGWAAFTYTGTG
jgi:CHAT domain-containing protein